MPIIRRSVSTVVVLAGLACGGSEPPPVVRDSAAQRAHDSTIGEMALPGTSGVRGALKVADSAAARRAREDSANGIP